MLDIEILVTTVTFTTHVLGEDLKTLSTQTRVF